MDDFEFPQSDYSDTEFEDLDLMIRMIEKSGKICKNCGNKTATNVCLSGGVCYRGYIDGVQDCWIPKEF